MKDFEAGALVTEATVAPMTGTVVTVANVEVPKRHPSVGAGVSGRREAEDPSKENDRGAGGRPSPR